MGGDAVPVPGAAAAAAHQVRGGGAGRQQPRRGPALPRHRGPDQGGG